MNKLNVKGIRIIFAVVLTVILLAFIGIEVLGAKKVDQKKEEAITPALAPAELVYGENFFRNSSSDNISYSLTPEGRFIIKDNKTDKEYVITSDQEVFEISPDKELIPVDEETKSTILDNAVEIIENDDVVKSFFGDIAPEEPEPEPEIPEEEPQVPEVNPEVFSTNPSTKKVDPEKLPPIAPSIPGLQKTREEEDRSPDYVMGPPPTLDTSSMAAAIANSQMRTTPYEQQNAQESKQKFTNNFASNPLTGTQLTSSDLAASTIINMTLITGLNTDLPGQIVAQVNQNVYDTLTGKKLLIPKGTRLIASYDSSVSWGQKRALIAWTQMIRPDGYALNLPGFSGIDSQGYAGYQDKVDTHTWEFIGAAMLASIIDFGASEVIYQANDAGVEGNALNALGSFTGTMQTAGQKWLDRVMNRQPTIRIRPGRKINMLVTQTITLPEYKER